MLNRIMIIIIGFVISILSSCNPPVKNSVATSNPSDSVKCEQVFWRAQDSSKCYCILNAIADTTVGRIESYIYVRGTNSPISDVQIKLKDASRVWDVKTNEKGFFEVYSIDILGNSPGGIDYFSLSCHNQGFKCMEIDSIPLGSGGVKQIEIRLQQLLK
jgi:hypothetical protein